MKIRTTMGCAAAIMAVSGPTWAVKSVTNTDVGPLMGPTRPLTGVYGTDLGFTVGWGDYTIALFGDTHSSLQDNLGNAYDNDAVCFFSTTSTPGTLADLQFSAYAKVTRSGDTSGGPGLIMDGAKTPATSFSAGPEGYWYGIFVRGQVYAKCSADTDCGDGLKCDKTMGGVNPSSTWETFTPCWMPHSSMLGCGPVQGNASLGVCRDRTSSMATYADATVAGGATFYDSVDGANRSEYGKLYSSALVHEIGAADIYDWNYVTEPFVTNKFINVTTRSSISDTNYSRPTISSPSTTVWAWGRPGFYGNGSRGAPSDMYLARTENPNADVAVKWLYRTASGTWSSSQLDAAPLAATGGWEDGPLQQTTVTYLEGPKLWVMLYGGDMPAEWNLFFGGPIETGAAPGDGSVKLRTSPNPWGPWSAATHVLGANDPAISGAFCVLGGKNCNPLVPPFPEQGPGMLYGASIVEAWDSSTATTATIGWFVSLWNPYLVHQIKTTIVF